MKYYLAIDLGASSGRHIVGHLENKEIILEEIYRFKTGMDDSKDGLVWDIPRLYKEIITGIKLAFEKYKEIESLSIDTWGVDYVLLNGDEVIKPFYAYRNKRNELSSKKVLNIINSNELYKKTGIQFASFNTIYQLYDDQEKGRLNKATDYLMLPSYFIYKLTGVKTHEYTNESTTGLLNSNTRNYDFEIIDRLGLPRKLFGEIKYSGEYVGDLLPTIQKQVGGNSKVILCASHDTASAFESVDIDEDTVLLSSGTWSLLGIKNKNPIINEASFKANYTNEGGVGYIRILKNIMGMWIANKFKQEINFSQEYVNKYVIRSNYKGVFDVNDTTLLAPKSMKQAILMLLEKNPPNTNMEIMSSIYRSMALGYQVAIKELEDITGRKYQKLCVIGGGAKNEYLNNLIEEYTELKVNALPIEATALGNIKIQMKASKEL